MRFTSLLTLLAATSVLSYSVKRDGMEDFGNILDENNISNEDIQKATNELNNLNGTNEDNLIKIPDDLPNNLNGASSDDIQKIADEVQNNLNGTEQNPTTTGNVPNLNNLLNTNISKECMNVYTGYVDCFGDPQNISSNEEVCKKVNDDKCKNILKQDYSVCGNELEGLFDLAIAVYELGCMKNENGKSCPQEKIFQNINADFSDKDIQEICKSNTCTENALDGFTRLKKSLIATKAEKDSKAFEGYLKSLNECKQASGTTQVKVGSALLATLALAFYLF